MYKIALICEHGASTGLCVQKMKAAAKSTGVDAEIAAHSVAHLDNLVNQMDVLLIGPQLSYKLDAIKKTYPQHACKFSLVDSMDFGMMDGGKILKAAMAVADKNN
jgi:PTS system cellobiose-specific IIB component